MRPVPVPDEFAELPGFRRVVVSPPDGDLLNPVIAPVEMLADIVRGDVVRMSAMCQLDADDLAKLQAGGYVWVSFYGGHVIPFSVDVTDHNGQ